jgi:hypothetical protein
MSDDDVRMVDCARAQRKRAETRRWTVTSAELGHAEQLDSLRANSSRILSKIAAKLRHYRRQDERKGRGSSGGGKAMDVAGVARMLLDCDMTCVFCGRPVVLLYEHAREPTQWTLDRVDNDRGHDADNVEIACLACNLGRRRIGHAEFQFSKNLVVEKLE